MNKLIGRICLATMGLSLIIGLAGCNSTPVQEGTPPTGGSGGSRGSGSPAGSSQQDPRRGVPGSGSPRGGSPGR